MLYTMKRNIAYAVILSASLLLIGGCSRGPQIYGEPIEQQEVTPLSAILADAKGYEHKTVLVDGKITLECPTGCWFDMADQTGTIYVDIASGGGFSIPQKTGSKIKVQGEVNIGESGLPFILGKGVEIR